jgi:hypothetical protein
MGDESDIEMENAYNDEWEPDQESYGLCINCQYERNEYYLCENCLNHNS